MLHSVHHPFSDATSNYPMVSPERDHQSGDQARAPAPLVNRPFGAVCTGVVGQRPYEIDDVIRLVTVLRGEHRADVYRPR